MRKRALYPLLAGLLALSLTACALAGEAAAGTGPAVPASAEPAVPFAEPASAPAMKWLDGFPAD